MTGYTYFTNDLPSGEFHEIPLTVSRWLPIRRIQALPFFLTFLTASVLFFPVNSRK